MKYTNFTVIRKRNKADKHSAVIITVQVLRWFGLFGNPETVKYYRRPHEWWKEMETGKSEVSHFRLCELQSAWEAENQEQLL